MSDVMSDSSAYRLTNLPYISGYTQEARRKEEERAELAEKQQRVTLGKAAALDKTTVKAKAPAATPMKGEGGAARKSNKPGGKAR